MAETLTEPKGDAKASANLDKFTQNFAAKFSEKTKEAPAAEPKQDATKSAATDKSPIESANKAGMEGVDAKAAGSGNPAEVNFGKLRSSFDEYRTKSEAEREALRKQLADETAKRDTELELTRKELEKRQEFVDRFYVENSDKFKSAFEAPIDELRLQAKESVGSERADEIADVLEMRPGDKRDKALRELATSLENFDQVGLNAAYTNLKALERKRDAVLASSKDNKVAIEEVRKLETAARIKARKDNAEKLFHAELSAYQEMQDKEGDADHNGEAAKARQEVKELLYGDLQDSDLVKTAFDAVRGRRLVKQLADKDSEIAKLNEQIKGLSAAQPGMHGSGNGTKQPIRGGMDAASSAMASRFERRLAGKA